MTQAIRKQITYICWYFQLDRPINATDAVRAVEYLRAGGTNPVVDEAVETAGWGSLDDLGSRPDKLMEVEVDVFNPARCRRGDYFGRKFTSNMMCAHRLCPDPCDQSYRKQDSCDVSLSSLFKSVWKFQTLNFTFF